MAKPRPLPFGWIAAWRDDSGLPSGTRLVLLALASFMDKRGVAFPSVGTLERVTALSRRQVFRHLKVAVERGWLAVESEGGPIAKGGRVNLYRSRNRGDDAHVTTSTASEDRAESEAVTWEAVDLPSGDMGGSKVVSPMSPRRARELQKSRNENSTEDAVESIPTRRDLLTALNGSPEQLFGAYLLPGFDLTEASWILDGLTRASQPDTCATFPDDNPAEIVAVALRELLRRKCKDRKYKDLRWTRSVFLTFVERAIRIRTGDSDDPDSECLSSCWPLEAIA